VTGAPEERTYVGRGALKLRHALDAFSIDPAAMVCADFGCNVGGFTDCLLRAGAARVYAVDTGYGALDYRLRTDERVVVMERTNALHAPVPDDVRAAGGVRLVVIDMGWTPQRKAVPAALAWLAPGGSIVTLIKPHYELGPALGPGFEDVRTRKGVLDEADAQRITDRVIEQAPTMGVRMLGVVRSPVRGGASKGNKEGNAEWLAHFAPSEP